MTGLQFITHFTEKYSYLDSAMLALEGGCRWIQLRMKDASYEELKRTALAVQTECRRRKATFIIDDCVELVKEIGADGVHLGKNDMPVDQAREILGNGSIFGIPLHLTYVDAVTGETMSYMPLTFVLAPGAFLVLGYLMILFNKIAKK